jgi:hypothetical protein
LSTQGDGFSSSDDQGAADADDDPLFFGARALLDTQSLSSVKQIRDGETHFWKAYTVDDEAAAPPPAPPPEPPRPRAGKRAGSSTSLHGGRGSGRPDTRSDSRGDSSFSGVGAAGYDPGPFTVLVSRSSEPQVAWVVAELLGVPEKTALDRLSRKAATVARGISKNGAQLLVTRIRRAGGEARILYNA